MDQELSNPSVILQTISLHPDHHLIIIMIIIDKQSTHVHISMCGLQDNLELLFMINTPIFQCWDIVIPDVHIHAM